MTRYAFIERILRQIYNGQPSDDSSITYNQVNQWLNDAIALAARKNYTDSIQMDGISYVNNSFYTTFKALPVVNENVTTYSILLPVIPVALGTNEGVATLQFIGEGKISQTAIPLSINQVGYIDSLRPIQNKLLYWIEGKNIYVKSSILLSQYTANVRMISGGDSTNLQSTLIIPDDYVPMMIEYIKAQLAFERSRPIDASNDGVDNNN
jgi:hypothetical protein